MRLILDTNRYSDLVAQDPTALAQVQASQEIWLPFIVLGELRAGFALGTRQVQNEQQLQQFLNLPNVEIAWADNATTLQYSTIYSALKLQGSKIPTNDMWIAALALQHHLSLYTRDQHFQHVPGLQLV